MGCFGRKRRGGRSYTAATPGQSFACSLCKETFSAQLELEHHREHDCSQAYVCKACDRAFVSSFSQLGMLLSSAAEQLLHHRCHECPHGQVCSLCGESFLSTFSQLGVLITSGSQQLAHHQQHECLKAHVCDCGCGEAFTSKFTSLGVLIVSAREQLNAHRMIQQLSQWETPADGKVYKMFHGTSKEAAACIECEGFSPSTSGMLGPGVYCSRDLKKASAYGPVIFEIHVNVGRVARIDRRGHPLQMTWQRNGYDTAWVPPNCGMVASGLEEDCVRNASVIKIKERVRG